MRQQHTNGADPATPIIDRPKARGNWNPNWDPFAELEPAWTEKFMNMGTAPLRRGALDLGVTKGEILAVLQAVSVLGIHSMSLGAPLLVEELARRAPA
jgi:hypothetical protein